jgi:dsDNA-specific endonuclease/ATPase MutS2
VLACVLISFLKFFCSHFITPSGHSIAINIAEKLGLPLDIIESSRHLLGTAGAEINAVCLAALSST